MNPNQRQEFRLGSQDILFIETFSASPGSNPESRMVICSSVDVSANGLKVLVDEKLPMGAIYQLCVELPGKGRRLYLSGQVKWVTEAPESRGFHIGIAIFESDNTDVAEWKLHIADVLTGAVDSYNPS
jgi:Tfp pilus assembly protein PilZ